MTAFVVPLLKAAKRGPKPKRPIRRSAMKATRKRLSPVRQTKAGRRKRRADLKWSKAVLASGPCAAMAFSFVSSGVSWVHLKCFGRIDPAHIFSRRYAATRTDPSNGVPLCRTAHTWFTEHPRAWEDFCAAFLGAEKYAALRAKAEGFRRAA